MTVPVEITDILIYLAIIFNVIMNIRIDLKTTKLQLEVSKSYVKQEDFKDCKQSCRDEMKELKSQMRDDVRRIHQRIEGEGEKHVG